MGMSSAEKQRKYRMNRDANPARREAYLTKSKQKYASDKAVGKRKFNKDRTKREIRSVRKYWKEAQQKSRQIKKRIDPLTPPSSPDSEHAPAPLNRPKNKEKRIDKKNRAKCYRDNLLLENKIKSLNMKVDMFKKRWLREKTKLKDKDSPRSKTKKILRTFSKKAVTRTLLFHNALLDTLKSKYREEKKKEKIKIAKLISGPILRKYKLKTEAFKIFNIKTRNCGGKNANKTNLSRRIFEKVKEFYLRYDNSHIVTGIKNTVTKQKKKKQRRILSDSLKNLHLKFLSENNTKLSYSLFCRLRPFWVLLPTQRDRNTCMCKMCDNASMMCQALCKAKAVNTDNIESLVKHMVCDPNNKCCMYMECKTCKDKQVNIDKDLYTEDVIWYQWQTKTEMRTIKKGKSIDQKEVSFVVKERFSSNVGELADKFEGHLERYRKHVFNVRAQFKHYKITKENLKDDECLIHVDFSENYVCKMSEEIQSMHFGASKKQITLHTGIFYIGQNHSETFCTVSTSLNHGPGAIWAHIKEILAYIKTINPDVNSVEFFSDGPTAQYKQKANFYLLTLEPSKFGFTSTKWSFFESGHGKGIPDAVGGSIKRKADNLVKYGQDITSAKDFVNKLKGSKTYVKLIEDEQIIIQQSKLENVKLKAIPGTLKLHQIIAMQPGHVAFRELSCNCISGDECSGHQFKQAFVNNSQNNEQDQKPKQGQTSRNSDKKIGQDLKHETQFDGNISNKNLDKKVSYRKYLKQLNNCQTYSTLKKTCKLINAEIVDIDTVPNSVYVFDNQLEVDIDVVDQLPDDLQDSRELYPCEVHANGNCLPSCASVFAFGNVDQVSEMRVRIILEQVEHEKNYLDNKMLNRGIPDDKHTNLASKYAQYSDMYVPGTHLTTSVVKKIFENETLAITKNKSFMGIWQIHALSNVLKTPIFSVYPKLGNPNVRKDLHRLIVPFDGKDKERPIYILWTSTREDMSNEHWVPNHFEPVLPFTSLDIQDESNDESPLEVDREMNEDNGTESVEIEHIDKEETKEHQPKNIDESDYEMCVGNDIEMADKEIKSVRIENNEKEGTKEHEKNDKHENDTNIEGTDFITNHNVEQNGSNIKPKTIDENDYEMCEYNDMEMHDEETKSVRTENNEKEGTKEHEKNDKHENDTNIEEGTDFITNHNVEQNGSNIKPKTIDENDNELCLDNDMEMHDEETKSVRTENYEKEGTKEHEKNDKHENDTNIEQGTDLIPKHNVEQNGSNIKPKTIDENDNELCVDNDMEMHDEETKSVRTENYEKEGTKEHEKNDKHENDTNIEQGTDFILKHNVEQNGSYIKPKTIDENDNEMCVDNDIEMKDEEIKSVLILNNEKEGTKEHEKNDKNENDTNVEQVTDFITKHNVEQNGSNLKPKTVDENDNEMCVANAMEMQDEETKSVRKENNKKEGTKEHEKNDKHKNDTNIEGTDFIPKHNVEQNESNIKPKTIDENDNEIIATSSDDTVQDNTNTNVIPPPDLCVGKYVLIHYEGRPYPGYVEDSGLTHIFVECMHQIGKKSLNCFYWPKKIRDRNWYDYESILTIIPEPKRMEESTNHFRIDQDIWEYFNSTK